MRIAFVVSSFPSLSETFIINQIVYLLKQGHEVQIFSFKRGRVERVHEQIPENDLLSRVIYLKEHYEKGPRRFSNFLIFLLKNRSKINFATVFRNFNFFQYKFSKYNLRFFYKYLWILREPEPDIIHAHFGPNGEYIARMKSLGFLPQTKLITSFHGYDLSPKFSKTYLEKYKHLFKEADLLTVNGQYMFSILSKLTASEGIKILPVAVDTTRFFFRNNTKLGQFTVLYVGRLIELKGSHIAIEILEVLVHQLLLKVHLVIVGEGEEYSNLLELVKRYKLEKFVTFKGSLTQEEVAEEMGNSDVFLFPGIHDKEGRAETQGLVLQEAQATGLPVIVSNAGGMKDGLLPCETGFVVQERDIKAFAEKIELLYRDRNLREEMGRKANIYAVENFDSGKLGARLEGFYRTLLNK